MKPPIRYYGGKIRLAPWIVSLLPEHRRYIEPFFGAGAVFFAKHPVKDELVNDLDGTLVAFMRQLRDDPAALADACRLTPYARDELLWCRRRYDEDVPQLERARRFFVTVSQSFASTTGSASGFSASLKKNVNRARSTHHYIDRFAQVAARLAHVHIENHDAVTIIDTHSDAPGCLIYCDPPYVHSTRGDSDGGHGYRHEMSDEDHRRLAEALHATPATVVISGYHSDLYDDLYGGWHTLERDTYTTVGGIAHRDARSQERTEVLWSNVPLDEGRLF